MKEALNVAMIVLFVVLTGLAVSVIDSCRGYEQCLKTHSVKTCKEHWGKTDELDEDDY